MRLPVRPVTLVIAGVAVLGLGMALVAGGVRIGPLFMPGVFLIGAGLLLAALGGIGAIVQPEGGTAGA